MRCIQRTVNDFCPLVALSGDVQEATSRCAEYALFVRFWLAPLVILASVGIRTLSKIEERSTHLVPGSEPTRSLNLQIIHNLEPRNLSVSIHLKPLRHRI
jgi:hypothetical protein